MLVFVSLTLYVVTLAGHNMAASVGSVVVFGSTGQTGSSAVAAALKKGETILCLPCNSRRSTCWGSNMRKKVINALH